jgi:hypothetical protein
MGAPVSAALPSPAAAEVSYDQDEDPAKSRRLFLIEGAAGCDSLARLLAPFAIQQALLTEVRYSESGDRFSARLEVAELSRQRAETLAERLRQFPIVTSVCFGWLGLAAVEA